MSYEQAVANNVGINPEHAVLTLQQQELADYVIAELDLTSEELSMPVTWAGATATIRQGIDMCIDHIADMDEDAIRAYIDMLKELSLKQQGHV